MKTKECSSLSGLSTLSYKIGCKDDKEVSLSIVGNTGKGIFNKEPVELAKIDALLASHQGPITSGSLHGLFEGKSSNSAGFILAVLLAEGLLKISTGNQRHYERVDQKDYEKIVQGYTKKKTGKKAKEVSP